ncbi:CsbD family protein [Geomesophilobacter sediminis]|uniref:CsbD family protein n=1 Tax=Geomesophilobacter sediminis TaxID=2798584 RepID=A0A8J7LVR0_9BACT|nr:CsbD family protein [Geomesophilobacter sediminis]MBJ6725804.1 CsbD family protein [Geomesophilobacter sediminis]
MRESTKERVEGKYHEAKGKVKEYTGEAIGKPDVALKGRIEKTAGKAESALGKAEKNFDDRNRKGR